MSKIEIKSRLIQNGISSLCYGVFEVCSLMQFISFYLQNFIHRSTNKADKGKKIEI